MLLAGFIGSIRDTIPARTWQIQSIHTIQLDSVARTDDSWTGYIQPATGKHHDSWALQRALRRLYELSHSPSAYCQLLHRRRERTPAT